ncbi:MAG: FtsW/RodA/SpoVE family cell cycle protein [Lachnospiraceae bacterium]|jgi:cell division protein FtsW (lipid II flippase)|nr:FtsW/RodA/SpoVE family cell cycle protein [Lachnospiraceae bacterium]
MALVISDLSKYVMAVIIVIYTLECFAVFRFRTEEERSGIYMRQIICMFLTHFIGFAAICLETGEMNYIVFYGFQQILLFATIALFRLIYPESNKLIINNMCMLLSIGFVILTRLNYSKAVRQFKIVAFSLVIGLVVPFLVKKIRFLKNLSWVYGIVGIASLSLVAVLGPVTHGSKITFTFGGYTFQPSEIVKIVFVFFVASMLAASKDFLQIATASLAAAIHVIILVISKDLGSALIFFVAYVVMVFIATHNYFYFFLGLIAGAGASVVAYHMFSHVRVRVQAWQDPLTYIDSSGYQIAQSLFAIGTGGWFGMGLCQGDPTSIPYVEEDSVFSAIAEEQGVLFALCLILICVSCFMMFMHISMCLREEFYRLIAVGLSVMYIFQIFLTIGGGTRFIPLTGVTLPLISYGGSSVLTTIIMFSIIQGLYGVRSLEGAKNEKET